MVIIINKLKKKRVPEKKIKELMEKLSRRYRMQQAEVVVSFVGPETSRKLNRKYRHRDKPTDVLSFALKEKGPDGQYYLGDIIICPEVASRQARKQGHSLTRELEILAIHGFLHLLGFEHSAKMDEEEEKVRSWLIKGYKSQLAGGRKTR